MRLVLALLATLVLAAAAPAAEDCQARRCALEPALEKECPCDGARSRGDYVSCVSRAARTLAQEKGDASALCLGDVVRCAAQSTCGRPGAVACQTGPRCRVVASAERCRAFGGTVTGRRSCCPACTPAAGGTGSQG